MCLSVTISNQIKCYNFSACPTEPQFLEEAYKSHKPLKKDELFRKRIEVIQDFEFPIACKQVQETPDQNFIFASGIYPSSLKIYETSELSLKCSRGIDSQIVKFCLLSDDYKKVALACEDRNIELHAQYGRHYKTRVPKMPTDMVFNPFTCDLIISSASNEIDRLSLDEGKFLQHLVSENDSAIFALNFNDQLNVLYAGGQKYLTTFDYKQRSFLAQLQCKEAITSIQSSNLNVAIGCADGSIIYFDVRKSQPLYQLQHQYRLPINQIHFNEKNNLLISSDEKIIKFFNLSTGNIEPQNGINGFTQVKDSGMFLVAQEQPRVGIYFLPQLDPAPKWCPFLDNLTEELEEEETQTVYDEFKFVSYSELEELDALHLLETRMIKQYLHGYLIHLKLYHKLSSQKGFTYENYKQQKVEKELEKVHEKERTEKGYKSKNQDVINEEFKQSLEEKGKPAIDQRFEKLFKDEDYKIDKTSELWKRAHPSEGQFTPSDGHYPQKPFKLSSKRISKKHVQQLKRKSH